MYNPITADISHQGLSDERDNSRYHSSKSQKINETAS